MRRLIGPTILSAVTALVGVVLSAPASQAAEGTYVAFGDSFASGPGIAPQKPGTCARSERNYATLLAAELGYTGDSFVDVSCGGAQTKHLWEMQGANAPQLDALSEDTTLVTFGTIGGNDIGLVGLAQGCIGPGSCVPAEGTDPLAAKFAAVETALNNGIDDTQELAPGAQIVVVGYGTYLPPGGCVEAFGGFLTVEEFDYVQGQIDRLSDLLADIAADQGVDFVDMREIPFSLDHTACAAPNQQWIRAVNTYDDGAPLHPSRCGMDAMFQHLRRELVGPEAPAFDNSCVSGGPGATAPTPSEPGPSTTPTPAAPQPSQAQLVRQDLLAQAGKLRLATSCSTSAKGRRFVLRVKGNAADVRLVRFLVGEDRPGTGRTAPWRIARSVDSRPSWSGKAVAKVKLERAGVKVWQRLEAPRPRCLR